MVGKTFSTGPWLGDPYGILVGNFEQHPDGIIRMDFGWKFWNGPRLEESEGFFVKNMKVKRSVK